MPCVWHSFSKRFRRCPQHRLRPCPKLWVAQPVLFRRADRASANIEVHLTSKSESRVSRESVGSSMSSQVAKSAFVARLRRWRSRNPRTYASSIPRHSSRLCLEAMLEPGMNRQKSGRKRWIPKDDGLHSSTLRPSADCQCSVQNSLVRQSVD